MSFAAGTRFGSFEIVGSLGAVPSVAEVSAAVERLAP